MKQLAVFARNLAGIHLKNKEFAKAYPYAKIAYDESKKAFLLNRTYNTADLYSWNATNIMHCTKQDSDPRKQFYEEVHQALDWMDEQYAFPKTDESRRYLYTLEAEGSKELEMREKALEISRRLHERFPEGAMKSGRYTIVENIRMHYLRKQSSYDLIKSWKYCLR